MCVSVKVYTLYLPYSIEINLGTTEGVAEGSFGERVSLL